jgi:hypothetical protein
MFPALAEGILLASQQAKTMLDEVIVDVRIS